MARVRLLLLCALPLSLASAITACSSSSNGPAPVVDAGIEDATPDTSKPGFIADASVPPTLDAGSHCDQLRAQLSALAAPASACIPNSNQPQCTATTNGLCCRITVSTQNVQAVNDYDQAVATFKNAGCTIDCTKIACQPAPSRQCEGTGDNGACN